MYRLNLPPYPIKVTERDKKQFIFDFLRRKYVALTPEEWVRQHFVHYLIEHKGYPHGLMGNEIELHIGDKKLRCDTLLYNKEAAPRMIIEYKAPTIKFQTIRIYNISYSSISLASVTFLEDADLRIARLRPLFFSSEPVILSILTPASSGSIMIRPQYSHTMIFLCILMSS